MSHRASPKDIAARVSDGEVGSQRAVRCGDLPPGLDGEGARAPDEEGDDKRGAIEGDGGDSLAELLEVSGREVALVTDQRELEEGGRAVELKPGEGRRLSKEVGDG